jgi:chemotaxis signal transduction protein
MKKNKNLAVKSWNGRKAKLPVQKANNYSAFKKVKEKNRRENFGVREIIQVDGINLLPQAMNFIKGVINFQGRVILVLDLRYKYSSARDRRAGNNCLLVLNQERNDHSITMAIMADSMAAISNIASTEFSLISAFGSGLGIDIAHEKGEVRDTGIILQAIERILA